MNRKKSENGITLTVLVITIVVILILAGISIDAGGNIMKRAKLENLRTDMLLIKAKGREYVENANFKLGMNIENASAEDKNARVDAAKEELKGTELSGEDLTILNDIENITQEVVIEENTNYIYYFKLNEQDLEDMGFAGVKSNGADGYYFIRYDVKNCEIEIYNTKGFILEDETYYSLNNIEKLEI